MTLPNDFEIFSNAVIDADSPAMKEIEEIDWEEIRAEMEHSMEEMKLDMDCDFISLQ